MIQVVIIILFIIFLVYSIRCLNRSETYTINKLYISWENKNYIEESVDKWILVLENSDGNELHKIENIDVSNLKNFEPVNIPFIENKDFDGKIFGDNKVKVYYNKKIDSNIVITTNIRFDGTDFSAKLSDIEYSDSNFPDKFIDPKINTARYVWYGSENSTTSYENKLLPIQTIAVYSDGVNITKDIISNSIRHNKIETRYGSDGEARKVFKGSSARDNRTYSQNATWIKSLYDTIYKNDTYTGWIQIDLGKEYPIDKVVVDRGDPAQAYDNWKINENWEDTFVKLKNAANIEVSRSTDKVPSGQQATDYKEDDLTKGIKTFTFPDKNAKVDCIGIGDIWGTCSETCGPDGKKTKSFKELVPARNGGSCPKSNEEQACNRKLCDFKCNSITDCPDFGFDYITEKNRRYNGDSFGELLIPSGSMTTSALVELRRKIIEASDGPTKRKINFLHNIESATGDGEKVRVLKSHTTHYWRTKFILKNGTIDRNANSWDSMTGDFSITIQTGNDAHIGWILVNDQLIGKPSSKSVIGGGEFKLTSFEVAKIEIFLYDKSGTVGEDTHGSKNPNMMRVLFKAPVNNTPTHRFSDFKYGTWDPPQPTSDFFPPVPPADENLCDKIDLSKGVRARLEYEDCEENLNGFGFMGDMMRNDPWLFDMMYGEYLKDDERSDFNKRIYGL